jgi:antitoxin HigA-1
MDFIAYELMTNSGLFSIFNNHAHLTYRLLITIKGYKCMVPTNRPPTRPGEVLLEEFLKPHSISQVELAKRMGIPLQRINTLIKGKRACSAETALLLANEFGNSPEFWMNLQNTCDLYEAKAKLKKVA